MSNIYSQSISFAKSASHSTKNSSARPKRANSSNVTKFPESKWVQVYINGDEHFSGYRCVINKRYHKDLNMFLSYVTEKLQPSFGAVRNIFTPNDGHPVRSLDDLIPKRKYVISGYDRFKKLDSGYADAAEKLRRNGINPKNKTKLLKDEDNTFTVQFYQNGKFRSKPNRVTFLTEEIESWELIFRKVHATLNCGPAPIKRIFTINGKAVVNIDDLFNGEPHVVVRKYEIFKVGHYGTFAQNSASSREKCCQSSRQSSAIVSARSSSLYSRNSVKSSKFDFVSEDKNNSSKHGVVSANKRDIKFGSNKDVKSAASTNMKSANKTDIKTAGKTNIKSANKTDVKTAGKTNIKSANKTDLKTAGKTDIKSANKTSMKPSNKISTKPLCKIDAKPSNKTSLNPPSQMSMRPASKAGRRPASRAGIKPSNKIGIRPSSKRGFRPSSKRGFRPSSKRGFRPSSKGDLKPSSGSGIKPSDRAYIKSASTKDNKPASKEDIPKSFTHDNLRLTEINEDNGMDSVDSFKPPKKKPEMKDIIEEKGPMLHLLEYEYDFAYGMYVPRKQDPETKGAEIVEDSSETMICLPIDMMEAEEVEEEIISDGERENSSSDASNRIVAYLPTMQHTQNSGKRRVSGNKYDRAHSQALNIRNIYA